MGRVVRMVPAGWEHPRYTEENCNNALNIGKFIPLREWEDLTQSQKDWDDRVKLWEEGYERRYNGAKADAICPKPQECLYMSYDDYAGPRPSYANHMPKWPEAWRTHYQLYETTTEGTPLSPVMATKEELARWLTDTRACFYGDITITYEQWLAICNGQKVRVHLFPRPGLL